MTILSLLFMGFISLSLFSKFMLLWAIIVYGLFFIWLSRL
jgi:undecaprenyl pyrophosphate phosphatase UppP